MATATLAPQTTPPTTLLSATLASADVPARLGEVLHRLGDGLDHAVVWDLLESLDLWLPADSATGARRWVGRMPDEELGARLAMVDLVRGLGAPLARVDQPVPLPKPPSRRLLHDVEVLAYRRAAVGDSARATALLGALEAGATTVELAACTTADAALVDGRVVLSLPGSNRCKPGPCVLPAWVRADVPSLLDRPDDAWLLIDSDSTSLDRRNSTVQMAVKNVLRAGIGWAAPSPSAVGITAGQRLADTAGFEAAHRMLRNKNPDLSPTPRT